VNGETFRGETTGVMTPVVNIRRPTVDWGVNLRRSVVCLRVYTCSPINAYTCTHIYSRVKPVTYLFQLTYRSASRLHLNWFRGIGIPSRPFQFSWILDAPSYISSFASYPKRYNASAYLLFWPLWYTSTMGSPRECTRIGTVFLVRSLNFYFLEKPKEEFKLP